MNSRDIRNLQEAYIDVYQELGENTAQMRANVPHPNQRTMAISAGGNEPPGEKFLRGVGQRLGNLLPKGRMQSTTVPQRKPLQSTTVPQRKPLQSTTVPQRKPLQSNTISNSYDYDIYDLIIEYLIQEGYADSLGPAEIILENMSEEWIGSIIDEAYKKLPIEKMMWKVQSRAEREADRRADRERAEEDPTAVMSYSRAINAHKKAQRDNDRSYHMIKAAGAHSKKEAKLKSKYKK